MRDPVCYGRVVTRGWAQEWYCTESRDARRRAQELRRLGYLVTVAPMGYQVTGLGKLRMTLVDVRPGMHPDVTGAPAPREVRS